MKKAVILIVFMFAMLLCSNVSYAAKALTRPIKVTLQDGRQTTVYMHGDENFHFFLSKEGETIVHDGQIWRVATEWDKLAAMDNYQSTMRKTGERITGNNVFPHVGKPKALVIMAQFPDKKFTYTREDIDSLLNGRNYDASDGYHSYSSMAQYFSDMSNGQFRPEFDVVGPVTLPKEAAYYGQDSSDGYSIDIHYQDFVRAACQQADTLGVDFSKYDNYYNDGCVDLVFIVHAGFGENMSGEPDELWAKSGTGNFGTYDGKTVVRFGINQELLGYDGAAEEQGWSKDALTGIGVMAHEFCHTLGLPDFYPTIGWDDISNYDNQSMEEWDLMDAGENSYMGCYPTPLTAFERELFGWSTTDTLTYASNVSLSPLQDGGKAYKIVNPNDDTMNEYYMLENIPSGKGKGWYRRMHGNGMVVTHINYNVSYFNGFLSPNNNAGKPRITILPADGKLSSGYWIDADAADAQVPGYITSKEYYADEKGDPYPGTSNVTELTEWQEWYPTMNCKILDIAQDAAGTVTFNYGKTGDVNFDGLINVADVTALVDIILGKDSGTSFGDVNGDTLTNVADVTALVDIILGR